MLCFHVVILRFVQRYQYPHTKFVLQAIVHHTVDIATDHYGLRVLKAVVEAGPSQRLHDVFEALTRQTTVLVENQYGNYIMQVYCPLTFLRAQIGHVVLVHLRTKCL